MANPPPPRIDFSFVKVSENKCILFGGSDGYRFLNDMYILDIEKKTWIWMNPEDTTTGVENNSTIITNTNNSKNLFSPMEGSNFLS